MTSAAHLPEHLPAQLPEQLIAMPAAQSAVPSVAKTPSTIMRRTLNVVGRTIIVVFATAVLTALVFLLVARHALKPAPGEWATTLRAGPVAVQLGVPSVIWLGTTPWVAALLDGRSLPTRVGTVHLRWQAANNTLTLACKPCQMPAQGLGSASLHLAAASVTVRRQGAQLDGSVYIGNLTAAWHGAIFPQSLKLQVDLPPTPIRDGYALFVSSIPELQQATIDGTFGFKATVSLPSGSYTLTPRVEGFAVHGLGTEALARAQHVQRGSFHQQERRQRHRQKRQGIRQRGVQCGFGKRRLGPRQPAGPRRHRRGRPALLRAHGV